MPSLPPLPGASSAGPLIPPSTTAPAAPPAAPAGGPNVPAGLDPKAYILTKAIAYQENGGKTPDYTVKGGSGEYGAYQYLPATWTARATKYLGANPPALQNATPDQQNEVTYKWVEDKLSQGYTPAQVASMHNAGDGAPNAYLGNKGTNSSGVNYDTKSYVNNVQKYAEMLYNGQTPGGSKTPDVAAPTPPSTANNSSGAFFPASSSDSPTMAGLKAAGNLLPSAFNFTKNAISSLNPIGIAKTASDIGTSFGQGMNEGNNPLQLIEDTVKGLPAAAYQTLVPKAAQQVIGGDLGGAAQTVENDPFGQVAPFVFGAKGVAEGVDSATSAIAKSNMADYVQNLSENTAKGVPIPKSTGTNLGGAVDSAISKIAAPVVSPIDTARAAFGGSPVEAPANLADFVQKNIAGTNMPKPAPAAAVPTAAVETAGKVLQGDTGDAAVGARVLGQIDTTGVKTYEDLSNKLQDNIKSNLQSVDEAYAADKTPRTLNSLEQKVSGEVGGVKVSAKVNYVKEALGHLQELYTKTRDVQEAAQIKALISKAKTQGLTPGEINMIARKYGTEFGTKAFSARTGEALTSVNARAYENVRSGLKDTARNLLTDDKTKALDKTTSDMIKVKKLSDTMAEKVNKLEQRVVKRNVVEKIARAAGQVIDFATFGGPKAFVQKLFFPSNVGLKTMNSIDLESQLSKNLRLIKSFEKGDDTTFANSVVNILKATNNLPNSPALKASVFGRPSPIQPQLTAPTQ